MDWELISLNALLVVLVVVGLIALVAMTCVALFGSGWLHSFEHALNRGLLNG